ncbi:hypothetical protein [Anabaena sp. 4-3]|nr:hypothetical protein [Anabaena sp. 4-3]
MNSLKKFMGWAKILTFAFALSCLMFCFPTGAMADSCSPGAYPIGGSPFKTIKIQGGSFEVATPVACLTERRVIRAVTVSLKPETATGSIDTIVITGPGGKREFGCVDQKVKNGTNLIKACGGTAVLEPGDTIYSAKGSGFGSEPVNLQVNFSDNFQ